ncbi:hypothetical protein L9F63_021014, partial [Diploptera punctata]
VRIILVFFNRNALTMPALPIHLLKYFKYYTSGMLLIIGNNFTDISTTLEVKDTFCMTHMKQKENPRTNDFISNDAATTDEAEVTGGSTECMVTDD